MVIAHYLALSAADFRGCSPLPPHIAWLSCRFSPYGSGLINLPKQLPPDSLCILEDSTPMAAHSIPNISAALSVLLSENRCRGLILDFQRQENAREHQLAAELSKVLPVPVAAPPEFASQDCILFLPPAPPETPLQTYLKPWHGRRVWLDTAPNACTLVLSEAGCRIDRNRPFPGGKSFLDSATASRYHIALTNGCAEISLCRDAQTLPVFLEQAGALGVELAVGLWQEFAS